MQHTAKQSGKSEHTHTHTHQESSYKISIYDIVFELKCYMLHLIDLVPCSCSRQTSFFKIGLYIYFCHLIPLIRSIFFAVDCLTAKNSIQKILCGFFIVPLDFCYIRSFFRRIQTRKCYPCIIRLTISFEWFRCCVCVCMNVKELQLKPHYNKIRACVSAVSLCVRVRL